MAIDTPETAASRVNRPGSQHHSPNTHPGSHPGLGISTQAVHAGEARQKDEGAISTPTYTASTYTFESTAALLRFVEGADARQEYGRYGNPNELSAERKLAALEGAESAVLYSSGMAAIETECR